MMVGKPPRIRIPVILLCPTHPHLSYLLGQFPLLICVCRRRDTDGIIVLVVVQCADHVSFVNVLVAVRSRQTRTTAFDFRRRRRIGVGIPEG